MIILLFVLEASKDPSGLALLEVPILVVLDGQNPAAGDKVLDLVLPHVNQDEDVVVGPRVILSLLGLHELMVILSDIRCRCFFSGLDLFLLRLLNEPEALVKVFLFSPSGVVRHRQQGSMVSRHSI